MTYKHDRLPEYPSKYGIYRSSGGGGGKKHPCSPLERWSRGVLVVLFLSFFSLSLTFPLVKFSIGMQVVVVVAEL